MVTEAVWNTYIELGTTAYQQGYSEMGERMLEAAFDEVERLGHRDARLSVVFNRLAGIYYQQGNLRAAENVYRRALIMYDRSFGDEHPAVENLSMNLAELYFSQGKYLQALPLYERSLLLGERRYGKTHLTLEKRLLKLAWVYCTQQRFADAQILYKRAHEMRKEMGVGVGAGS